MQTQIETYGTQQVMTSNPVTLVALLYDKAVMSLRTAIEAIRENEIEKRWTANNKAVEIIKHLMMTLDTEQGGEIASNLEAVYGYILRRLLDVDMKNDARAAEEVIQLLEPLRASWTELAHANDSTVLGDSKLQSLAAQDGGKTNRRPQPAAPAEAAQASRISLSA